MKNIKIDDYQLMHIKKELADRFSIDNWYYLHKALQFLHQFQAGRLHQIKCINYNDIRNLSPVEIAIVMTNLEDSFGTPVINKLFKTNGYFLENTPLLNLAITLLETIKSDDNKYLLLKDGVFWYNGTKLRLKVDTHCYNFLKAIYICLDGKSGVVKYELLHKEIINMKRYRTKSLKWTIETVQKYVTSKTEMLGKQLLVVEQNNLPLLEIVKSEGIRFNNGN